MDCTRRDLLTAIGFALGAPFGLIQRGRADRDATARLRPPGAGRENEFLAACIRCGQCVEACPWGTLELDGPAAGLGIGTPSLTPRRMPCYICEGYDELKCVAACPTTALLPVPKPADIRMGTAVVDEKQCTAFLGAFCRACSLACPIPGAIVFDELQRPIVRPRACIGCGICEHVCPTRPAAITIRPASAGEGGAGA